MVCNYLAADRISHILDGVLIYSQVNFLEEVYEPVDLNEVIRNVASDLELQIQEKAASLHYSNLPKLEGVQVMLYLVFYNLISNSLKFSRMNVPPVITITGKTIDQKGKTFVWILFSDNGIGFEQKYAEKIFGSFTRLHAKDKYEGAGLGLSICKKIIERHGGTIVAKGEENTGSEFEILLPVNN